MSGVGQVEEKDFYKLIVIILEAVKKSGKLIGFVFICQFLYVIFAVFVLYIDNRNDYEFIVE